ncbi:MAG: hypothetical protein WBQ39_18195, partial [Terriglobales bacterium]
NCEPQARSIGVCQHRFRIAHGGAGPIGYLPTNGRFFGHRLRLFLTGTHKKTEKQERQDADEAR